MLEVRPKSAPLGAVVEGLDLHAELDRDTVAALRDALLQHEVLFFPEANLTPTEQIRLGRIFGNLQCHAVLDALADAPEVVVFDTARKASTAEWWHSDVTCAPEPPMGAMLQMVVAPPTGGATHWASVTAAYDALDDDTKTRIEDLHALHRSWWEPRQEAVHPVVRVHPENGRRAIFVNGIFTKRIVELDERESADLLAFLFAHATRPEFTVRHDWHRGDIAFWDNRSTQHRVDNDFGDARRCGHRVTIDGDAPRGIHAHAVQSNDRSTTR
jgi:taurine dioxygenase